jgi:polysaccharide pyruvyl transferase WcaK-like protein
VLETNPDIPAKFCFQWLGDFTNEVGEVVRLDPWLKNHPKVQVIQNPFGDGQYSRQLSKTGAMILPYRSPYRLRVSRVIIEAMLYGMPTISTSETTLCEQSQEFGCGISCVENDVNELVYAIQKVVEDFELLQQKAQALASSASRHFSVENFSKTLCRELALAKADDFAPSRGDLLGHKPPLRILLKGYYGNLNLGDDLLMAKVLEQTPENSSITVLAIKSQIDFERLPKRKLEFQEQGPFWTRFRRVFHHDVYMLGGGGLFPNRKGTIGQYAELIAALLVGKKIVIVGISVNPAKTGWERLLWNIIRARADFFSLRDKESVGVFYRRLAHGENHLAPDVLLSGFPAQTEDLPLALQELKGCVIFIPAWFPAKITGENGRTRLKLLAGEFERAMANCSERSLKTVVVSFFPNDDSDLLDLLEAGRCADLVLRYQKDFNFSQILCIMKRARLCVSMRFHGLVASVLASVPSVTISYDYKFNALLDDLGYPYGSIKFGISPDICHGFECDLRDGEMSEQVLKLLRIVETNQVSLYPNFDKVALQAEKSASELRKVINQTQGKI